LVPILGHGKKEQINGGSKYKTGNRTEFRIGSDRFCPISFIVLQNSSGFQLDLEADFNLKSASISVLGNPLCDLSEYSGQGFVSGLDGKSS